MQKKKKTRLQQTSRDQIAILTAQIREKKLAFEDLENETKEQLNSLENDNKNRDLIIASKQKEIDYLSNLEKQTRQLYKQAQESISVLESEISQFHLEKSLASDRIAELETKISQLLKSTRAKETAEAKRFEKFSRKQSEAR